MGIFKRGGVTVQDDIMPNKSSQSASPDRKEKDIEAVHAETTSVADHTQQKWKVSKAGDGDVAMAFFNSPDEVHEPIDPADERKLKRKIDWMILPYLGECIGEHGTAHPLPAQARGS